MAAMVGFFMILIGLSWLRSERRKFDPHNEYAFIIGLETFAFVTPRERLECDWSDLGMFVLNETVTERRHGGTSTTYEVIAKSPAEEFDIPLEDFATRLGSDERACAQAMCAIFNAIRANALRTPKGAPIEVPIGLTIGPLRPKEKTNDLKATSVIERQSLF